MLRRFTRLIRAVERDQNFVQLQYSLLQEFEADPEHGGPAFRKVVEGAISALSTIKSPDAPAKLNAECVLLLEEVATYCRTAYPWPLVKLLLLVVWSHAFDELYEMEQAFTGTIYSKQEYYEERRAALELLFNFRKPPMTLQRLAEIPLRQTYMTVSKLVHAYRKVMLVRPLTDKEVGVQFSLTSEPSEEADMEALKPVEAALSSWFEVIKDPRGYQWHDDYWLGFWETKPEEEPPGPVKRPLEA
ncbi:hypothetical protein, conserved [Babesia bigemina]|uniref:Uncharacterized protein n=1 Tax=Babesia bigemina TaxID=5866 RepID=A0A061D077_BABBI|nr:hypothetical protein, conserved [Babesia bigemina]CDR94073.1 hypothetical protein, conserved [Babesia bigemina]|eukprot:XP_012766259.1 hypothetical protein, conserved [Babesia bigemina]